MTKKGIAMVEMKNSRGADNVLNHLNRIKVLGSQMSVGVFLKIAIFSIYVFCGEATKKTSIDGLKWRDLVMGRWWLVNFKVSGVTKGFMC